jgi:DNA-binding PadR family transcriptional regulator
MDVETRRAHHAHHDHQGWVRPGGRRGRWLEPFLLLLVAEDEAHGYSLIRQLNELGVAPGEVDVGMVYRTLRELEAEGLVDSSWAAEAGAPRRDYRLTPGGRLALAEWAAVMDERARLIAAFQPRYARLEGRSGG